LAVAGEFRRPRCETQKQRIDSDPNASDRVGWHANCDRRQLGDHATGKVVAIGEAIVTPLSAPRAPAS
jgi:hypothetical protein